MPLHSLHLLVSTRWAPAAPCIFLHQAPYITLIHMSAGVSPATLLWATLETEVKSHSQIIKTKYRIHFPKTSDFVYLVPQLYVHYYCNIQMLLNKTILSSILRPYFTDSKIHYFFILTSLKLGSIWKSMKRKYWVIYSKVNQSMVS